MQNTESQTSQDSSAVPPRSVRKRKTRSALPRLHASAVHPEPHPEPNFESQTDSIFTYSNNPEETNNGFIIMGNTNKINQKKEKEDKSLYLSSSKVVEIMPYFNYSAIISHGLDDYLHGIIRGKLEQRPLITYDSFLHYMAWFVFLRTIFLAFIEDLGLRTLLGETERIRPERQLVMVATIWSIYFMFVFLIYENASKYKWFTWLAPFQVLRGQTPTKAYGLNTSMAEDWYHYMIMKWRKYILLVVIRSLFGIGFIVWAIYYRWSTSHQLFKMMQVFWSSIMIFWMFFTTHAMYITYIYFRGLCYYFTMRFAKINDDIERIISGTLKSNERIETLRHILVEHNELCLKMAEYNQFWSRWLMSSYFFLITQFCFTLFQALFTTNPPLVRILMAVIAAESAYFLTTLSVGAAVLSNTAHQSYRRLIRVTFDKYPVELQIQLRMFIQRLSGPTIGFYCLDIFEISYTTYASIVAALGQNFLLIVDFVRSYAEVGRDEDQIRIALARWSQRVFNTTITAIAMITESPLLSNVTDISPEL